MAVETMKTLTVTQIGSRAELVDTPLPKPDDNSVLLKTIYAGVSVGTEMWVATGRRLEGREAPFAAAGYQATGEIVAVGSAVEDFRVGEVVVGFCKDAHAQYTTANAAYVHRLPATGMERRAALFVMPSVGGNALNHASVNTGDNVLIIGQGLIGQCTAQLARLRGAYVAVAEVSPERMAVAREHCADWVIDAGDGLVSEQIKDKFPWGFDVVLESTGFQHLVEDAMQCVRGGGRFVFEGWYPDTVAYTFHVPHSKQLRCFYPSFIGERPNREGVLRLIASGKLAIDPLISHEVPWQESADLYTRLFTEDRDHFNGIVFDWTA